MDDNKEKAATNCQVCGAETKNANPLKAGAVVNQLRTQLGAAIRLLDAADCPQCGDKSGAYYDSVGEVCQCQWCDEVGNLKASKE